MGANSHIEWCDHTFNPWEGCKKVSPGCAHCYAEARNQRFAGGANWGKGAPRRRTSVHNWNEPRRWEKKYLRDLNDYYGHQTLHGGQAHYAEPRRPRVFCASLADWLDDEVPLEWLTDLLWLICETPHLDWLLLTKRPQNWRFRLQAARAEKMQGGNFGPRDMVEAWLLGTPPANVWIGTTVEDQQRANERIPALLSIPARVRFLSCEPLLGPIDLINTAGDPPNCGFALTDGFGRCDGERPGIHWVICGGESGLGARPMHPLWARALRFQCQLVGVPFFFKQWGEYYSLNVHGSAVRVDRVEIDGEFVPASGYHDHDDGWISLKIGKKKAGRLLDEVEYSAFPAP